jgi:hypothetical protein
VFSPLPPKEKPPGNLFRKLPRRYSLAIKATKAAGFRQNSTPLSV